jgi:transposase-like protein
MRRKRRNHSASFKAKVAFTALKGDKTLAQLASEYDVHVNQIQSWRNQLKENMTHLFDSSADHRKDQEAEVNALQAKIGQLTMENDFLAKVLKP